MAHKACQHVFYLVTVADLQCVRIHPDGRMATVFLKRRDLLRLFSLDARDLRCIDPNLQYTRSSPSTYVRGNVILAQLAGMRLIITANTALLLDPHSGAARKLLGQLIPKLQVSLCSRSAGTSHRAPDDRALREAAQAQKRRQKCSVRRMRRHAYVWERARAECEE
jgi:hypothetical protein